MVEAVIFYGFSTLIVLSSLMVITRKNPVASAVYLIATLFLVAAFFAFMGADFVAAIQILVYAGAIMVLFLFVIMLLNLEPHQLSGPKIGPVEIGTLLITVIGFVGMAAYLMTGSLPSLPVQFTSEMITSAGGNTRVLGLLLFQDYVWPFELASMLILLAIVASILIAKKEKPQSSSSKKGSA